ncbi:hypothetical protein B4U79_17954 [Dinothrombium tinctorium]|uniref:Platelet-derived growth factor (PDGF) family profile domain-containing protein n=1 Tax=Dinothrombium tinctorium TaxID=1965070 RepID=A0A3S3PPF7_9ACAR|nr:hypothetical protein B4U79_18131 [Dinothrombium tinctorium]RWS13859.1 hypothetical protein B4U79_17954 [Dinothrombium tinctorium]
MLRAVNKCKFTLLTLWLSLLLFTAVDADNNNTDDVIYEVESKVERAVRHGTHVYQQGACRDPKPRIIYPPHSSSKVYFPRGTILHRCGDDVGCCHHSAYSCQAVESEVVELYFMIFSPTLEHKHRRSRRLQVPEKLSFVNHTRCACKNINEELNEV